MKKKSVLFIAPLSPPITGQSIISEVVFELLEKENYQISVVNFSKVSLNSGKFSMQRLLEIVKVIKKVFKNINNCSIIYLTVSESVLGNIKDLLIYLVCYRKLNQMIIHIHGGSLKRELWDKHNLLFSMNKFFIKRLGGVVILGRSHLKIVEGLIERNKIHIIPNFPKEDLFISNEEIQENFENSNITRILFLSNMLEKKGYNELCDSFFLLPENIKAQIEMTFAGAFDKSSEKEIFLKKISGVNQIKYVGVVDGIVKINLLKRSHFFCLPTMYFEGQPISILEAYSAGCVVLTTEPIGILDIFTNRRNGYAIEPTPTSISDMIVKIVNEKQKNMGIAIYNNSEAKSKYRKKKFCEEILKVFESI